MSIACCDRSSNQVMVQVCRHAASINCLQAQVERQASQYAAGPGPSSSSASSLAASLVTAPDIDIANPLHRTAFLQPHGRPAQRGGLARPPFAALPPALHSIPSQVSLHAHSLQMWLVLMPCSPESHALTRSPSVTLYLKVQLGCRDYLLAIFPTWMQCFSNFVQSQGTATLSCLFT